MRCRRVPDQMRAYVIRIGEDYRKSKDAPIPTSASEEVTDGESIPILREERPVEVDRQGNPMGSERPLMGVNRTIGIVSFACERFDRLRKSSFWHQQIHITYLSSGGIVVHPVGKKRPLEGHYWDACLLKRIEGILKHHAA